jgi:hypothetical protein
MNRPGIVRQPHLPKAACQGMCLEAGQSIGRAVATSLFNRLLSAIKPLRFLDPKSVRRIETEAFDHPAFPAGVADGSCRAELPLSALGIAAVLKAAQRAGVFERPEEEFGGGGGFSNDECRRSNDERMTNHECRTTLFTTEN